MAESIQVQPPSLKSSDHYKFPVQTMLPIPFSSFSVTQMASLRSPNVIVSSSSSSSSSKRISASIQVPNLAKLRLTPMKTAPALKLVEELKLRDEFTKRVQLQQNSCDSTIDNKATAQLCAILEAVSDRVEMHKNIGEQRDNWNSLMLNSTNMLTLSAATMAGLAAANGAAIPLLAFKLSSTLLFSVATGMIMVMNKIQPSQLVEEQRSAVKLFRQLQSQIQNLLNYGTPTSEEVRTTLERVLALDKAYPLPLLGAMLEKFPSTYEPAVWWPHNDAPPEEVGVAEQGKPRNSNGWSEELEAEMKEIVEVMKRKDLEDYVRLGNVALKVNKFLAITGPLLSGIAAVSAALVGNGSPAAVFAVSAGALACAVNSLEHGGQVGMVFEMYRNCGGFFRQMEASIESALGERDVEKRENGEVLEMKVALQLGRSLSQLRQLAKNSSASRVGGTPVDEFASKLF